MTAHLFLASLRKPHTCLQFLSILIKIALKTVLNEYINSKTLI